MNTHKRSTTRDKERYFITIKGFAQCEGLVILIMNASNKASKKARTDTRSTKPE